MQKPTTPKEHATAGPGSEFPFSSNDVRLGPGEWLIAGLVLLALFSFVPALWKRIEPLDAGADYRVPYRLGNDYWIYRRHSARAARQAKTLVLGDSVMWGHYVRDDETLSHYLNELTGEPRFANVALDGIHPAALAGLIAHYAEDVSDRDVILNANLLWMSSERHDLQITKEFAFNHPSLVPQLFPRIPCYKASLDKRLAIIVGREVPLLAWADHLRIAYYGGMDLPTWTMQHPYANPAAAITLELPSPEPSPEPDAEPWTDRNIPPYNPPWVPLATSFQWSQLRRTIRTLQDRGNRVFVVVGPFNEHMLTDESLAVYQERKQEAAAWLRANGVPHAVPPPLPSRLYADASHPLAEGYRLLAKRLLDDERFARFRRRCTITVAAKRAPDTPSRQGPGCTRGKSRKFSTHAEVTTP
jgi:hypothetical protein